MQPEGHRAWTRAAISLIFLPCLIAWQSRATQMPGLVDSFGLPIPAKHIPGMDINWALGPDPARIISRLCKSDHHLQVEDDRVARRVFAALERVRGHCRQIRATQAGVTATSAEPLSAPPSEETMPDQDTVQAQRMRSLLQNVIVPGNPLDRTFQGYASDFDILAILTVALNFLQENDFAGRNNSATTARAQTFKGGRFPFGVNFAVTNTFGAKTKSFVDFTAESNRRAAIADGAADARAIAFPAVGDIQLVQGVLTSALSQTRLQDKVKSPKPDQKTKNVPRIPLTPKFIPKFVVNFTNITNCPKGLEKVNGTCTKTGIMVGNLGTSIDQHGPVNLTLPKTIKGIKGPGKLEPGVVKDSYWGGSPAMDIEPWFGNLSVVGDGVGYKMYRPPDRIQTRLEQLDYLYYNGAYNDDTFDEGDPFQQPQDWHMDYMDPYFYVEYDYDSDNSTSSERKGLGFNDTGGEYQLKQPQATKLPPFKIFLATSLDYGRSGQYAYFYTNYFRFLYQYEFGPQIVPATGIVRQRSTSYVKRDERGSAAGAVQSEGTGTEVAAVGNSLSAATGNAITQSLSLRDVFGNDTFTGPPNVLTRYAGAQASAVAFGRSYYYSQPAVAAVDASTQANVNSGYAAGSAGGFTAYSSGSQFAGTRGQALGVTGEVLLDWDVGG